MAAFFPSADEKEAADGLLLLSRCPPAISNPSPPATRPSSAAAAISAALSLCEDEIASSCVTDSSSSAAACCRAAQDRADPLRLLAAVACLDRIKPKIMKAARSKLLQDRRLNIGSAKRFTAWCGSAGHGKEKAEFEKDPSQGSEEIAVSSLSSASSLSAARSGVLVPRSRMMEERRRRARSYRTPASMRMLRRAESIVALLATGSLTEMKIRQALGDSPDTSKALRMLLKIREVKRSGEGGRADPFLYVVATERGEVSST